MKINIYSRSASVDFIFWAIRDPLPRICVTKSKMIIEDILTLPVLVVGEGRCLRLDLCDWTIYYFPGSCVMDMSDKVKDDH